jgi:Bacterial PH domain
MTSHWSRPYPVGLRWLVVAWELGAFAFFLWTTVGLFGLDTPAAFAVGVAVAVVWSLISWRLMRLGVYVADRGVLIRNLVSSRTMCWTSIERIVVDESAVRCGRIVVPTGRTVVIELRDGTRVETPLWANGIDFQFRPHLFRSVYQVLREQHSAARRLEPARS